MLKISILTMFPELFGDFLNAPVIRRQILKGNVELQVFDIKTYAPGSFRRIDDSPYGGGAGMILRCQPVVDALRAAKGDAGAHVIALDPAGKPFVQADARSYARYDHLILICGHYEGMDVRIYDYVDDIVSIGDYVLTGGELPAMVMCDAIVRLTEGALREESKREESFEEGLLEYPQYTRPAVFEGKAVPEVLLSGNHEAIDAWRRQAALERTRRMRPDLLTDLQNTGEET